MAAVQAGNWIDPGRVGGSTERGKQVDSRYIQGGNVSIIIIQTDFYI